jgi:hypothetical protein
VGFFALVAGNPVTVCRRLLLFTEPRNPADGVERKLVAVEVIQYDRFAGRGGPCEIRAFRSPMSAAAPA